jgi:sec-independent protein translocase protein TatA
MKDGSSDAPAPTARPAPGQVANSQAADKTTIDVEAKQKS